MHTHRMRGLTAAAAAALVLVIGIALLGSQIFLPGLYPVFKRSDELSSAISCASPVSLS